MRNVLTTTYRTFVRNPVITIINLIGLAVSMALVIIIVTYTYRELTTDTYHKNGDRIFLLSSQRDNVYIPGILKESIDENVPEIETVVRIAGTNNIPVFQVDGKEPICSDLIFADADFFKVFTYNALEGDLISALNEPMSVVLSGSLSKKLFGHEDVLGKTIKFNNKCELTITAVFDDHNTNSTLSFNAITSNATRKIIQPNSSEFTNWQIGNFQFYLLLNEGADRKDVTTKIAAATPGIQKKGFESSKLIPLTNIYFSKFKLYGYNYMRFGNKRNIMVLGMGAILVLLIALINFINITSSRWQSSIKQTGIIKVIGATKSNVLFYVLAESFIFFLIAYFVAILLAYCTLPVIKSFTGIDFNSNMFNSIGFLALCTFLIFVLSIILSLIPAITISSSKAIDNIKKQIDSRSNHSIFRGTIVSIQFMIAIILIAFTILVQKQVNYGKSNVEINEHNRIGIKLTDQLMKQRNVLKARLIELPGIMDVSFGNYFPGKTISNWGTVMEVKGEEHFFYFDAITADANFFELMGLQLVMGRFFSDTLITDASNIVVNEAFVREQNLDQPIGMKFKLGMDEHLSEIVGVVKDFHYKPVNDQIISLAIRNDPWSSYCLIGMETSDFNSLQKTIEDIRSITKHLSPAFPVEITFLDQAVESMYETEIQFRRTFSLFAICALVICCLGVLAISLFEYQKRIKEIGIRKVNGAKVSEILGMLNRTYIKWVFIAFVVATPIAYYAMNKWLERFAYKTELSWWIFAIAGLMALGIALATLSWQSWRAATRNPVEALKYE